MDNYQDYKDDMTKNSRFLVDMGNYDVYESIDHIIVSKGKFKIVYHEDSNWKDDKACEVTFFSRNTLINFKYAIYAYRNKLIHEVSIGGSTIKADKKFWKDFIDESMGMY